MLPRHQQVGLLLFYELSRIAIQKRPCEILCILALAVHNLAVESVKLQEIISQ